jgi:peptidoglycan/LPS O-acetylase OafA/YrhL|tara:strand:- start:193 stop:2232 length:2040 start_codon:yes stop_codon:yes gene_type:complete
MNLSYRGEIDGLRALAVIPVVFFHAGFDLFSGGLVGVDIFFVISGYLITTIILKDLENNNFSLAYFYERRARRILPALFFVIFVSSILSFIFLTRSELGSYFKSVNATLLFYSNFYFWKTAPYFHSLSDLEPLLHTWSLSIEEQFYIIFPLILIISHKYFKKYILILLFFTFFLSLLICQIAALKTAGVLNFYFTLSRAWELALGGISAYYLLRSKSVLSDTLKNLLSLIGLIMILFAIFFFNRQTLYPSLYTLVPTIGTVLIILFANEQSYVKKILSFKILVGIGLMSYSFYLWHQPLLAFGRIYFDNFSNELKFLSIIISLFLSYFSYNFIEKLFRNKNKINIKLLIKILASCLLVFLLFSQLNINFFNVKSKNSTEARLAKLLSKNEAIYSTNMNERYFVRYRIIYENLDPKTLVIGSSRIMQTSNQIYEEQVLNLAVSGATIEDHITITEMALQKFYPDKILLGADPWLFNKYNYQSRWKSLSREYKLSLENLQLMKTKNMIINLNLLDDNFAFYENILEKIYNFLNIINLASEVDNFENNQKQIILKDGKRVYANKDKEENIKGKVVRYSMNSYEFSNEHFELYKQFIYYLINVHKKEVVLVLSPYHQLSYDLTIKAKPYYLELENKFRQLSEETNIQIVGSYNPLLAKCSGDEFYDYMHPKDSCMKKITKDIK